MEPENMKADVSEDVSKALAVISPAGALAGSRISRTELFLPDGMKFESIERLLAGLKMVGDSVHFWLGDLLIYSERNYGEMFSQLLEATDYEEKSLQNMMWVSRSVSPLVRTELLTWSHHREVAGLDIDVQKKWLDRAVEKGLTTAELKKAIQATATKKERPRNDAKEGMKCALRAILKLARDSSLLNEDMLADKLESGTAVSLESMLVTKMAIIAQDALEAFGKKD